MSPTTVRRLRWVAGITATVALVVLALVVIVGRANRQQADDPRSTTSAGAGALGALLATEGVRVEVADRVGEAVGTAATGRALVVVDGDELSEADAQRLLTAGYGRVILLRPDMPTLARFGVRAETRTPSRDAVPPTCPADAAEQAGPVLFQDARSAYAPTGPAEFTCYPGGGGGHAYLRVATGGGPTVELVGGGVSNALLEREGNAAFGMNVFGAQPEVTWLMARAESPGAESGPPGLLPPWWPIALAQAAVAFGIVAVWRGRRLGPIMTEPLPVTVRASETVEGHGRLYHRLNAYDRAARALRAGTVGRLSRAYGHADDPLALSAVLADRTGLDPLQVRRMLLNARPTTDDDLVHLARDLDRLEQEARRL